MKLDFRPTKVAFLDFETQSEYDLKKGTARQYSKHSTTKALTCVVKVDGQIRKYGPYLNDAAKQELASIAETNVLVAHNAPFDAAIWENALKLPEATWFDTAPCARAGGLPGGLDKLSKALGGRGKDKNGERLIQMLCILKPGARPIAIGPAHALLMDYNVQDVEELEFIYERVSQYAEPEIMPVDRIINERGIPVSRQVLETLRDLFLYNATQNAGNFDAATRGDEEEGINPKSPKQVIEWLGTRGFAVDSVSKPALLKLLANPDAFYVNEDDQQAVMLAVVKDALEMRKEVTGVGSGKVKAALDVLDEDDRIRDQLVHYGAHTGRWSGRKIQPHNMPSIIGHGIDVKNLPLTYTAMKEAADLATKQTGQYVSVASVLGTAFRTCIRADNLLVADYSKVEVCGLAWVAEAPQMLESLSDPNKSPYMDMGRTIFNRKLDKKTDYDEYQLCKSIILGCGYQMSGGKFEYTLATRDISTAPLKAAGLTAAECVKIYRRTYPEIPVVWNAYDAAVRAAVEGQPTEAGRVLFEMHDGNLHALLPSGRPIVYRDAKIEMVVPGYCKMYNMPEIPKPTVTYANPRGYRGFLYGGKITENCVQAICRDLMAYALVCAEQVGLKPVLHVHDEIVCEAEDSRLDELLMLMSDPPAWAKGFPIMVEGYSGAVFTKQPKGYREGAALLGKVLG